MTTLPPEIWTKVFLWFGDGNGRGGAVCRGCRHESRDMDVDGQRDEGVEVQELAMLWTNGRRVNHAFRGLIEDVFRSRWVRHLRLGFKIGPSSSPPPPHISHSDSLLRM